MPVFVLMTKLRSETLQDAATRLESGRAWLKKVEQACPGVKWIAHYALLGRYDFMDLYEAPDAETAQRVSILSRLEGAVEAESWHAMPYERYLELLLDVGDKAKGNMATTATVASAASAANLANVAEIPPQAQAGAPGAAPDPLLTPGGGGTAFPDPARSLKPAIPFDAEPVLPPGVPDLTLEQYAALLEELTSSTGRPTVLAHFGLTAETYAQLELYWMQQLRRKPSVANRIVEARKAYVAWRAQQNRE